MGAAGRGAWVTERGEDHSGGEAVREGRLRGAKATLPAGEGAHRGDRRRDRARGVCTKPAG